MKFRARCRNCGGAIVLAVEQETRIGVATFSCPTCGAPNQTTVPVRSTGERVRVDTCDEPDDDTAVMSSSQLQMVEAERRLARQSREREE